MQQRRMKNNSGCTTCRQRHVKCDEARPICSRCERASKNCHWSIIGSAMTSNILTSNAELRSFNYYRTKMAWRLSGVYSQDVWPRLILQASYRCIGLQHLIAALAALDEACQLQTQGAEDLAGARKMYEFCLEQYDKGIGLISANPKPVDPVIILASQLLIGFLEKWLNQHRSVEKTAMTSIHLLQHLRPCASLSSTQHDPDSLYEAFEYLMIREAAEFAWSVTSPVCRQQKLGCLSPDRVVAFTDPYYAARHLEMVSQRILALYYSQKDVRLPREPSNLFAAVYRNLQTWHTTFCHLRKRMVDSKDLKGLRQVLLLDMRYKIYVITARIFLDKSTGSAEACKHDFEDLVEICDKFVEIERVHMKAGEERQRSFSPDTGIVIALHIVGLLCRDPMIRRRAISILYRCKRVEGNFASDALGIVSEHVMMLEEAMGGCVNGTMPVSPEHHICLLSTEYKVVSQGEPMIAYIEVSWFRTADINGQKQASRIVLGSHKSLSIIPLRNTHWWPLKSTFPLLEAEIDRESQKKDGPHLGLEAFRDVYDFSFEALWSLVILRTGSRLN